MNKYLIAALYVVAGCVATLPINVRGGNVSVRTDCYRLLVSSTEKIITVSTEKDPRRISIMVISTIRVTRKPWMP